MEVKAQHDTDKQVTALKVKNIALPVNKLNNADGLKLMSINKGTSSTFFVATQYSF